MNQISEQFFTYNRPIEAKDKEVFISPNGVRWDQIERWYVDEKNELIIVLISQTEVTRQVPKIEKNKQIMVTQKVPMNVMVSVLLPEDIARFFDAVGQVEVNPENESQKK